MNGASYAIVRGDVYRALTGPRYTPYAALSSAAIDIGEGVFERAVTALFF
jgi:hypothetical protein